MFKNIFVLLTLLLVISGCGTSEDVDQSHLPEEIQGLLVREFRDSVNDDWRFVKDNLNFNMPENAIVYFDEYMEDGEIHFLVSFATDTTTSINHLGNRLNVYITEYEEGEEHSAKTIGSGIELGSHYVDLETGKIESN